MKGVLFTEFLELVEGAFGFEVVDEVIRIAGPALNSKGAYTSVGTYSHVELLALVEAVVKVTEADLSGMLIQYAERLMASFEQSHPDFFSAHDNLTSFLMNVESQMHAGVRKLYTDAQPPTLGVTQEGPKELGLTYHSHRPLNIVVGPLVLAAAKRYGEKIEVDIMDSNDLGTYSAIKIRIV